MSDISSVRHIVVGAALALALSTAAVKAADQQSFALVDRGRQLTTAADCMGCHTKPGGKPFAGGVALQTPFGTLVAPNITPDREAGIGDWTDEEFLRAVREGRGRGGKRLYPAMPYPSYTKMSSDDVLAIRAFLKTVDAVPVKIEPNQLPFPFNIRSAMAVWNALNFTPGRLEPDPSKSAEWNRGRYLVDALGHCGTCHTSKNLLGAEKPDDYLQGSVLQGWFAPNLTSDPHKGIGALSEQDIVNYLKTGANAKSVASGPMAEVIEKSTSHMSDEDLKAIAAYLKDRSIANAAPPARLADSDPRMKAGQAIFKDNCAACHTEQGRGSAGLFPTFAASPIIQSDDPTTLIRVVLKGTQGAYSPAAPTAPAMPSFAWRLSDPQVAAVLTYIRNGWGNAAAPVSSGDVASVRASP
jgi:mono/diheme cytochrome c family protein